MNKEEKILAAALQLFVTKGFHGTPTSQIAKAAGVANGTLFHYFKTKEDLINALYLNTKDELISFSFNGLEELDLLILQLESIWSRSIAWAMEHPQKMYFIQQFSYSPYISKITKQEADKLKDAYVHLLSKGIKQGEIKDLPLDLLFLHSSQQLHGLVQYLYLHPEQYQNTTFLKNAFQLFWNVIKKD